MYRVPYTGVSMSVALVRLHVLIKIFIGPYLRVTLSIHDIDFRAGLVADPSNLEEERRHQDSDHVEVVSQTT